MRRELARQSVHLTYGIAFTLLVAWNVWIGVAVSLTMALGVLIHQKRSIPLIEGIVNALEREDHMPGFGALTLTIGITSVILVFPESGIIAGIGVSIIDSIATVTGILIGGERKHLLASGIGALAFFIVATSVFTEVRVYQLGIVALIGGIVEYSSSRLMIIDDNITVPWAIAIGLALL